MKIDPEILAAHRLQFPISAKQKMLISMCKFQLLQKGIFESESAYREHLDSRYGVTSITELAEDEASTLLNELVRLGAVIIPSKRKRTRRPSAPNLVDMVSPQQLQTIDRLKKDISWRFQNGFEMLCRKIIKNDRPKTVREAQKIIEAMKGIRHNQQKQYQAAVLAKEIEEGPF